jgi:hypothetical protein
MKSKSGLLVRLSIEKLLLPIIKENRTKEFPTSCSLDPDSSLSPLRQAEIVEKNN